MHEDKTVPQTVWSHPSVYWDQSPGLYTVLQRLQ